MFMPVEYHRLSIACQYICDTLTGMRYPACDTLTGMRSVDDLIGDRPLTARSVLASALLGADEPRLPVAALIAVASLFGISAGATRTCLWRMVSSGELVSDDGSYALTGHLLDRRHRVDDAAHPETTARRWNGQWELAVVSRERRSAADRGALRKAAAALHLAEIKEGVWIRPDNLDPDRSPELRAILDGQCVHFRAADSDIDVDMVRSIFGLDAWARDARRLIAAMDDELNRATTPGATANFRNQFALAVAVVRHLQLDPLLPVPLMPEDWPATSLRRTYRRFDDAFKRRMNAAFRLL
jgi:phenylacetic acid degradation operon negative regulatory protein